MANRFFVQSADYSPALRGLQDTLTGLRQEERIDEEIARQRDREDRALADANYMENLRRQALGLDQPQGIVAEQQQDMPLGEFSTILNPESAQLDQTMLGAMGIDSPEKYTEVSEFADKIQSVPDSEIHNEARKRIEQGVAEGRDMRDTAELLTMPPAEAREMVQIAGMAVDNQILRQMYAKDPKQAAEFVDFLRSSPTTAGGWAAKAKEHQEKMDYISSLPKDQQSSTAKAIGVDLEKPNFEFKIEDGVAYRFNKDTGEFKKLGGTSGDVKRVRSETSKAIRSGLKDTLKGANVIINNREKLENLTKEIQGGNRNAVPQAMVALVKLNDPNSAVLEGEMMSALNQENPVAAVSSYLRDKGSSDDVVQAVVANIDQLNPENIDPASILQTADAMIGANTGQYLDAFDSYMEQADAVELSDMEKGSLFPSKTRERIEALRGYSYKPQAPQLPQGVTMADVEFTAEKNGVTVDEVLARINQGG